MQHERRRHPRLEIPLETMLRLADSAQDLSATIQDLSAGGAGLLTTFEIPVGTDLDQLRFELPAVDGGAATPIGVAAKVVRCEQQADLGGEAEFLIGVQFVDITRELFDRIQQFVFKSLRTSQQERVQIERPIAIRFDRFDDFVDEVSVNLSHTGMFIRTRDPRPPGSVFNFQFQLGEDFSLIEGRAEVVWRRRQGEGPDKLPGMGVKFVNLDVPSQRLVDRLVNQKQQAAATTDEAAEETPAKIDPEPRAAAAFPNARAALHAEPEAAPNDGAPAASEATTHRRPPPDLRHAEATIVGLGQVNALREAAEQLRGELDEARQLHQRDLQELRAQLEDRQAAATSELEERLRDAEAAHRDSERQRVEASEQLEASRQEIAELQSQVAAGVSGDELERVGAERDALRSAQDEIRQQAAEARGEADELRRQLDDSAREVGRLAGERDALREELEGGRAEAAELRRQMDQGTREAERLVGERDTLREGLEGTRGEAAELRRQMHASAREAERLAGERAELQALLADRTGEDEAQRLGFERDELQAARDRLLADLDRANAEADEMRRRLADQAAKGESEHQRLTGERAELQTAHDYLQRSQAELRAAHEALRTSHDGLEEAREALRTELEETRRQLDDREGDAAGLREELDRARGELEDLRRSHEAAILRLREDHSEALAQTAAETRKQVDARVDEVEAERQRAAGLAAELESASEHARQLETQLQEARADAGRLRGQLEGTEQSRQTIESEMAQVRDEARRAARRAEEREVALRAEAENAALALAGAASPEAAERSGAGRALRFAALLLIGALLGTLAVGFIEPLGSLAARLRPAAETTRRAALPAEPAPAAETPEAASATPSAVPGATTAEPAASEPSAVAPAPTAEPEAPTLPEPPAETAPDPAAAERAVRAWAAAWSAQRVDDYLASYADSFQPPDGQSRASWAANRRERIERPRSIQVGIDAARTVQLADDRVSVSFDQSYVSDDYADTVRKTLLLVWQDSAWKIAEERVIE